MKRLMLAVCVLVMIVVLLPVRQITGQTCPQSLRVMLWEFDDLTHADMQNPTFADVAIQTLRVAGADLIALEGVESLYALELLAADAGSINGEQYDYALGTTGIGFLWNTTRLNLFRPLADYPNITFDNPDLFPAVTAQFYTPAGYQLEVMGVRLRAGSDDIDTDLRRQQSLVASGWLNELGQANGIVVGAFNDLRNASSLNGLVTSVALAGGTPDLQFAANQSLFEDFCGEIPFDIDALPISEAQYQALMGAGLPLLADLSAAPDFQTVTRPQEVFRPTATAAFENPPPEITTINERLPYGNGELSFAYPSNWFVDVFNATSGDQIFMDTPFAFGFGGAIGSTVQELFGFEIRDSPQDLLVLLNEQLGISGDEVIQYATLFATVSRIEDPDFVLYLLEFDEVDILLVTFIYDFAAEVESDLGRFIESINYTE